MPFKLWYHWVPHLLPPLLQLPFIVNPVGHSRVNHDRCSWEPKCNNGHPEQPLKLRASWDPVLEPMSRGVLAKVWKHQGQGPDIFNWWSCLLLSVLLMLHTCLWGPESDCNSSTQLSNNGMVSEKKCLSCVLHLANMNTPYTETNVQSLKNNSENAWALPCSFTNMVRYCTTFFKIEVQYLQTYTQGSTQRHTHSN